MSTSKFEHGVSFTVDGKTYQLLKKIDGDVWQVEEAKTRRIHEFPSEKLLELYSGEKLKFCSNTSASGNKAIDDFRADYSQKQWEIAKIRRAFVIAIIDLPSTRNQHLNAIIQETWKKIQTPFNIPNAATVLRWKNKFISSGKDIRSLITKNEKKGNATPRFPIEIMQFIEQAINKKYLCLERGTIQSTLDHALILVINENNLRPDGMQLSMPTRNLVKRIINEIPAFDRYSARYGRTAATNRFRAVLAHRTTNAPLERAEIDHTPLDLFVVDDKTRLPLGRPWLTVCIDDYTRNVLGISIGFEPPSYLTVSRCLRHAFRPKITLSTEYPNIKNKWHAHGVMRELVVDNGLEFHSTSLENACYSLGIEIHYSPRKVAWFKGKIERFQGTLNRAISHGNPGTTFSNIFDKVDYNPLKHAVVSYSVLKEILFTWIVDEYHQKPHRTIKSAPAAMWEKSIAPEDISVPDDLTLLDAILGRSETRLLTHKGIELYGLLYNSAELTQLRRKHGDHLDVEVRVNTADLSEIVVLSPFGPEIYKANALNSEYTLNLSEWQHKICKKFAANELQKFTPDAWLDAKSRIASLIDKEFLHKKQKTRTKIARYKGDEMLENAETTPVYPPVVKSPPAMEATCLVEHLDKQIPPLPLQVLESITQAKKKIFKPIYRDREPEFVQNELTEERPNE